MNLPKGKHPSGQAQAYPQRINGPFPNRGASSQQRPDTYFANFHQGRNIHSGPPPPHHSGVLPGVVPTASVITQGGGGGVGGGGGGPAQAPTPPGASPHDMAKQGGGPPNQATHVGAHSQMPGASTFQMSYPLPNSQRHSGPQTQYYRTPNQQRMATNPRSQVMNSNGMPTLGFSQITPPFPVPQVHYMQHQWVSHRQAPGYTFSASAQAPVMFPSVYSFVSNQSQSPYMMPLRPPAAGANTGGGGHGGTPPQQQSIQQQSPVPLQQQTVMGAGGSPAGGISLGGGGGPSGHAVGVYQPVPMSGMVNIGGNVGQPTVQNKSKPRLHALPILDPVTGKNVVNEMLKSEENSGASDSPARTEKEEKIAEFSSKIGKAAASSSETDVSPPQPQPSETSEGTMPQISGAMNGPSENLYSIPSENVGLSQLGMNVSSEPWKQTSEKERDATVEPSICDTVNQKTVVDYAAAAKLETVMEEPESSHVVQNLALNQFEGQPTPVVSARGGGVRVSSPVAANVVPLVKQQPASIVNPLPVSQPVEAMPPPAMSVKPHPQAQVAKEVTREFPVKHQVSASKSLQTSHKPPHAVSVAGEGNDPMVTKKVLPTSREGSSERKKVPEVVPKEEEKKEEKTVETVLPTPVEEPLPQRQPPQANGDESIDGKPAQRPKPKNRTKNRELNRKGAEKEGTDMDAFSDAQQQQQKQEAAAAAAVLTNVTNAATAPVSQRIETPMQPPIAMEEKVVNESKSRTVTPPPANQVPLTTKTSALAPSVTPKGATVTNNENVSVPHYSNTSNKVESHPPKVPSSKPGNEKNMDNKLSTMEIPPVVPEKNFVSNSKRDEVEKEVSVEKITEDVVKEVTKTDQINENSVESTKVEKDMSTAEKKDKEEGIVAVKNNENKLSSLPPKEKKVEEDDGSSKNEQDVENNSAPGAPAVIENVASEAIISKLIAKNNYKEDQWSPINPQGKKKYERDFLLGLQNDPQSVKKPENLPDIDIVLKDSSNRMPSRQVDLKNIAHLSRNSQDFAPCFVKSLATRPAAPKRNSQQGKPKGAAKIVYVTIPSNSDVKLHEAENAWKPRNKIGKDSRNDQKETEELYAAMRGILNKLTPQNFEKLVQQVLKLPIDTMEKLVGVINLVFDKAVDEPNFSVAYAELCNFLNNANIAKQVKKDDSTNENFRKILLKRCQEEFEKDKAAEYGLHEREKEIEKEPNEEKRKEMRLQLEEDERRIRRQSVGVTRFIGELYKLGMINQIIMVTCIKELLESGDEESLECLCKLLTTVGKYLEESLEKKTAAGVPNTPNINVFFNKMKTIVSERKTSSRVRFMLQDVIDLRNSKWVPRRNEANPKKIDQINLEAERESMEQSQLTASYSQMSRGGGGMGRRDEKSKDSEWSTVQGKKFNVDPHKLKVTEPDSVQLGSRMQHSVWSKGATGGSSGMGMERKPTNMYNMLSEESGNREASNRRMPMRHKDSSQSYTKSSSTSAVGISLSEERERALSAIRDNVRGPQSSMESPRPRGAPPSKTSSRDSSVAEERSMANSKAPKAPSHLSPDALDKLCKMTLDDYLSTNNAKETFENMRNELPVANYVDFIQFSVEKVLETTTPVRQSVSRLLAYLITHGLFNKQLFAKGLNKVLAGAEELLLDVPMFWTYIADILGVMLEEEAVPLSILQYFTSELPEHLQGPLVNAVLKVINKSKGPSWVNEKWAESGLHWKDLIPGKNVESFVKENGLDYIVDGSGHGQSKSSSFSMDVVREKVLFLMRQGSSKDHGSSSNKDVGDAFFEWIEANVEERTSEPSFIRALTTAVIESAMENSFKESEMEVARKILQKYLGNIEKHELQCLYAVQALVNKLEHPKGLIHKVFEFLHNNDVISQESFVAWEKSSDEPDGKAVALKSLTQFFTYLTEPEDDSAEEA